LHLRRIDKLENVLYLVVVHFLRHGDSPCCCFAVWAIYAFARAGLIGPLPLLRAALIAILPPAVAVRHLQLLLLKT